MSSLTEQIVIYKEDPTGLSCGMKSCPFHRWTNLGGHADTSPIDSYCALPGDEGNVLMHVGHNQEQFETSFQDSHGQSMRSVKRAQNCLSAMPVPTKIS